MGKKYTTLHQNPIYSYRDIGFNNRTDRQSLGESRGGTDNRGSQKDCDDNRISMHRGMLEIRIQFIKMKLKLFTW